MKKPPIFHPLAFFLFPVLALYAHNIDQVKDPMLILPIVVGLLVVTSIFSLFRMIYKDSHKAGVMTSWVTLVIMTYGHLHETILKKIMVTFLREFTRAALNNFYKYDTAIAIALLLSLTLLTLQLNSRLSRSLRSFFPLTKILNLISIALLIPLTLQIFFYKINAKHYTPPQQAMPSSPQAQQKPDIYYIILDGYAREDVFKKFYDFDNSEFIHYLESRGFYVANNSHSNYAWTPLSLASSLNLKYINYLSSYGFFKHDDFNDIFSVRGLINALRKRQIDVPAPDSSPLKFINTHVLMDKLLYRKYPDLELTPKDQNIMSRMNNLDDATIKKFNRNLIERGDPQTCPPNPDLKYFLGRKSNDVGILYQMIENNAVVRFLKSQGYYYVHFDSTWIGTSKNKHADLTITDKISLFNNEYLRILAGTTILRLIEAFIIQDLALNRLHALARLKAIPELQEPTFTFAHIILPHPPFLFDRHGNIHKHVRTYNQFEQHPWLDKSSYIEQTIFTNHKMQEIIDAILSKSTTPPIIIIQSDHGPYIENIAKNDLTIARMCNLNAYFLPGEGAKLLYKNITPVNSFRIIFNHYFHTQYKILTDKYYFSNHKFPYAFQYQNLSIPKPPSPPTGQ